MPACRALDLDTTAHKVAWSRSGSRCSHWPCGLAEFWISTQLHDLWLGRVLALDETACKVALAGSGTRRNDTLGRFPVFQNPTKRHAQAFPCVPEHEGSTCHVTCSGSGTRWSQSSCHLACSGTRQSDMPCHLLGFLISQRAFDAQGLLGVGVFILDASTTECWNVAGCPRRLKRHAKTPLNADE